MTYTLQTLALQNNVPTNGMTVNAYTVTRFALPATDAAVPDGNPADAGPATSAADPVAGAGYFTLVVPDGEPYWLQASGGGDGHTYWYGPIVGVLDTTQQAYSKNIDQTLNRVMKLTTVAAASDGQVLPQATINVVSTAGFATSGLLWIAADREVFVQYTGKTGTTFTGCTTLVGSVTALRTGYWVNPAYRADATRRTVHLAVECTTSSTTDGALFKPITTSAGKSLELATQGILVNSAAPLNLTVSSTFEVDPNGFYSVAPLGTGLGAAILVNWVEVDL